MDVKQRTELDALMNDFYGTDAARSQAARDELINYGEGLIRANQLDDYQALITACAGIIADKGIDVTRADRVVLGGRAQEGSLVPAPIRLMRDFEEQAKRELGALTTGAVKVTETREIVEKLATTLSRQREIIEKIQREPSSIEGFVAAIDKNNELSQKQIAVENDRLKHFREYFPDDDAKSTINPTGATYKDSQWDKVHRADMQVQLLEDLQKTVKELEENEKNRKAFQQQLDNGDPDAQNNIDACKIKEQELKEKISKVGPDGRETGIMQRLKDFKIDTAHLAFLDIDRAEAYSTKSARITNVLNDVRVERLGAYQDMAQTVKDTLATKGAVDSSMASKVTEIDGYCDTVIAGTASLDDMKKAMDGVKGYVKYVIDDIQKTQDRVDEFSTAIEFRNAAKDEIEQARETARNSEAEARRLRSTPVTDAERDAWLDETITVDDGSGTPRDVVARDEMQAQAQAQAEREFRNQGSNGFTRFWRNVGFFFRHGFRTRDRMIAERAESLAEENINHYINERRNDQIADVEREGTDANRRLAGIETISRESRNDASVHTEAHDAAATITDENILSGTGNAAVDRAETTTAKDLSNMGYDIALQKWRAGEMTQEQFDRILKEHIENPDRKDRYAKPDETKGYTKTPEYRNPEEPDRG